MKLRRQVFDGADTIAQLNAVVGLGPERYITYDELAGVMGVSVRTLKRWVREGMPSETWGMARTRRFLASKCIEWAREREQGRDV